MNQNQIRYVNFEFEGKKYLVNQLAKYARKVVLPDRRVIKAATWDEEGPKNFVDTNSFVSMLSSLTLEELAKAETAYVATALNDDEVFEVGDKVTCDSEFGNQVLTVVEIIPLLNPIDRKLAMHSQWIIAELNGMRLPSKSGYRFKKVS